MKYLLLFLLSAPAFAANSVTTCNLPDSFPGSVDVTYADNLDDMGHNEVTTHLVLNGQEIPMIRSTCRYQDVPGRRGYLCAHQDGAIRYDVYPRFGKNDDGTYDGVANKVGVIRWDENDNPTLIETEIGACSQN
jgi:hypothetical protein